MMVLVAYDVATKEPAGRRRLARVAKTCLDYGQRVQKSLFECSVTPDQWTMLKNELTETVDPTVDSLRFYLLGSNWKHRVEHFGANRPVDLEGPLMI